MIGRTNSNSGSGGVSINSKPTITFDGKWSGWHVEFYEGLPYWEALFASSGALTALAAYTCDAWGIGGGGAGGNYHTNYTGGVGTGGGSGYTNLVKNVTIPIGNTSITIGAGGTQYDFLYSTNVYAGETGGTTSFITLSCTGGYGGSTSGGAGGSNGGADLTNGGTNGSPGDGHIMSKFWSTEHNTEYGDGGIYTGEYQASIGGGGGGYLDVGGPGGATGHGYGAGGSGYQFPYGADRTDWYGHSGCLIIRIPIS